MCKSTTTSEESNVEKAGFTKICFTVFDEHGPAWNLFLEHRQWLILIPEIWIFGFIMASTSGWVLSCVTLTAMVVGVFTTLLCAKESGFE